MTRLVALVALCLPLVAQAETIAFTGARVHTIGPQGTLDGATVLVRDGVIAAVGRNVTLPAGTRRIDASGKVLTPGLFSPVGQIGVAEVSAVGGSVDYVQRGRDFTASFEIADAFNPASTLIPVNRLEGITRAAITPEGAGPDALGNVSDVFSGLGAIVHLGGSDDPVVDRRAMLVVNLGADGGAFAGGSRAAALLELRSALDDARDYAANRAAYERGERRPYSVSRSDLEALQDVLAGRTPLLAHADRASDIRVLLALAAEYELDLIVAGGAEAWLLADELAAAGVGVILSAVDNLPASFDELNARLDSGALLSAAGVAVSFGMNRNMQSHNARNLSQVAGIAVAHGMTWEAALAAITLTPARLYGVADRLGSLEPGKDADIVVWPGDPLELTNYPEQVYIRGVAVPMESRQTLLRDRYLDSADPRPPAFRR